MMDWLNFVPKFVGVVLDANNAINTSHPLGTIVPDRVYLILGQVAEIDPDALVDPVQGINHYILLDYATGKIEPGMYHADRFRTATQDEM